LQCHPGDIDVARSAANFFAEGEPATAERILQDALREQRDSAALWLDLGRLATIDPGERTHYLLEARRLGSTQPNLLTWIATAAFAAGDFVTADSYANELLALATDDRRKFGDLLDWQERGRELRLRARTHFPDDEAAAAFAMAHAHNADRRHWGHTVKGLLALERDHIHEAVNHLHAAGSVPRSFRLGSYGPSFQLAAALCAKGAWRDVAQYLKQCERFGNLSQLRRWRRQVEAMTLPDFPGD
jgi:hypothetical protein